MSEQADNDQSLGLTEPGSPAIEHTPASHTAL
jgi:hypothetical protein